MCRGRCRRSVQGARWLCRAAVWPDNVWIDIAGSAPPAGSGHPGRGHSRLVDTNLKDIIYARHAALGRNIAAVYGTLVTMGSSDSQVACLPADLFLDQGARARAWAPDNQEVRHYGSPWASRHEGHAVAMGTPWWPHAAGYCGHAPPSMAAMEEPASLQRTKSGRPRVAT